MAKNEATGLRKEEWSSRFNLIGEALLSDFTYRLDARSEKSDWVYNSLNLGVFCGEHFGNVYCELMGGYGSERDNVIWVHGKNEDKTDDFSNSYTIAWEDRFDEDILKDIGELCFIRVGLERTDSNDVYVEKFLSPYDAIAHVNKHLEKGMVISVSGQLKYSVYNGSQQCKKEINSIMLAVDRKSKNKEALPPEAYHAFWTQTMLLDRDSITKDSFDKDKSAFLVEAYVLEKFKEFNGWDLTENGKIKGGQLVPLKRTFEYVVGDTPEEKERAKKVVAKLFKVKKDVTQVTFEGEFVESGATVQTTIEDLPEEIRELIEYGIYSEEDALARCSENTSKERRMIITRPVIKMVGEEGNKTATIQRVDGKFKDTDLLLKCLSPREEKEEDVEDDEVPFTEDETTETTESNEEQDWLDLI